MYGIEELIGNYTEDELADGAVLALSEPFDVVRQKTVAAGGELLQLRADFDIPKTYGGGTWVRIDPAHGELAGSRCGCEAFREDTYACRHTVALQVRWLLMEKGRKALERSPLKDILVRHTGIADPFAAGVLRETTADLREIFGAGEPSLPETPTPAVPHGSLKLEIHLGESAEDGRRIHFKVAAGRSYVVRDADSFLRAFDDGEEMTFGSKLRVPADPAFFDAAGQRALAFLREIRGDEEGGFRRSDPWRRGKRNTIQLSGLEFDILMERFGSDGVYVGNRELFFSREPYRPRLTVRKEDYGAFLEFDGADEVAYTPRWIYVAEDGEIRRMRREESGKLGRLLMLARRGEEMYVAEKDLPRILPDFLPEAEAAADVYGAGIKLSDYLPQKARYQWYLDYPQRDMISCRAKACYDGGSYPVGARWQEGSRRDRAGEMEKLALLGSIFQAYEEETQTFYYQGDEGQIYDFLTERLPKLEAEGEVFVSDQWKKLRVRPLAGVTVGVAVDGGKLLLNLSSGSFSQEELVEILSSFRPKRKYYRLKSGAFVKLDAEQEEAWTALADCVRGLRKPREAEWKLPLFRALYLDEMLQNRENMTYGATREYRRLLENMRGTKENGEEPPKSLAPILRPYQADGFRWIRTLKENGFGGILADDMGLGKTLQTLAFLLSEKERGKAGDALRTLIVTPASLVFNWKQEIGRYTPALGVRMIVGTAQERRDLILASARDADAPGIWITSYDLLKRDIQWYEGIPFANEILDEAQYIKNQTTHASKAVRLIDAGFRLALTGTPIENRLGELWSIFDYLMPGFLYSYKRFREEIETPAVNRDAGAMERLRKLVHPFILRRLKKDVLAELPDKLEEEVAVPLEGEQKKYYDAHAQRLKLFLEKQTPEEFAHGKLEILAELTRLRQLCCGPELVMEDYRGGNAKLEACMELIGRAVGGGHKLLLFSQFTSMLDRIGERLREQGIAYHRIDGSVGKEERIRQADAFAVDDVPVFCISLKAGGTGLNLTQADIVIHYDPWWNLAAQNQATDRTHRIGQTRAVTVYQLIAADTIEERIVKLQKSKYQLAQDVLSGGGIAGVRIDRDEVLSLLDPTAALK